MSESCYMHENTSMEENKNRISVGVRGMYTFPLFSFCLLGTQRVSNVYFLGGKCDASCDFYSNA